MSKKKQLLLLEEMLKEGKKREEIERKTGIKKTDISILKSYIEDLKSMGEDKIILKYKQHFQQTEQETETLKENLNNEKEKKEALKKEVDFQQEKFNHELKRLEQEYSMAMAQSKEMLDSYKKIIEENIKTTGIKLLQEQKNVLAKIDYEPQKTAWQKFLMFAIFPLTTIIFFQQWQLKQYHDIAKFTPSQIKEMQKYQVNQTLIDKDNKNWLFSTENSGDAWISKDCTSCAIRWKK
jgi:hypothetical protein